MKKVKLFSSMLVAGILVSAASAFAEESVPAVPAAPATIEQGSVKEQLQQDKSQVKADVSKLKSDKKKLKQDRKMAKGSRKHHKNVEKAPDVKQPQAEKSQG